MIDPFTKELIGLLPWLRYCCLSFTGRQDANDLVQEVLLVAWERRETFIVGTKMKSWLWVIARNRYLLKFTGPKTAVYPEQRNYSRDPTDPEKTLEIKEALESFS